ncbi:MAG TPA: hypothetical protein VEA78_03585, partial [Acidimicrobiales bacterium]|nr:hypothetical protein [Acidimicrobiales bacterium]
ETAEVVRTDVVDRERVDGTLGYRDVGGSAAAPREGTVTWLAPEGSTVTGGAPLFSLDGEPVLLLVGDVPLHRDLVVGMHGDDVAMLNRNLGLDGDAFIDATAAALRERQSAAGGSATGVLRPDGAVVLSSAVRVGTHALTVGTVASAGAELAAVTSDELVVVVALPASKRGRVAEDAEVQVELPSDEVLPGDIESIDPVVTEGPEGEEPTIEVVVTLDGETGGTDGAPVDVAVTTARADDVLAVPVGALLALAEGGYAIEVVGDSGTTSLVAVELGLASDDSDLVEIMGDVSEGDTVVIAA